MEIIEKKIAIKLDKEERDNLIATIDLLARMEDEMSCDIDCPFKERCDQKSDAHCLLREVKKDLIYINNKCE